MKTMRMKMAKNAGFSLVELMVAMVLGLVLIAGLLQLYVPSRQVFKTQGALAAVQENGNFAVYFLGKEIRKAGYFSDPRNDDQYAFPADATLPMVAAQIIRGQDNVSTDPGIKPGTDVLMLRYRGSGTVAGDGWITDCLGANVNEAATSVMTLYINNSDELVCRSVNTTSASDQSQPLAAGIENMQLSYGVDTLGGSENRGDNEIDSYQTAAAVADWTKVLAVSVELLSRSTENNTSTQFQTYLYNGNTVTATDHYLRRVYRAVIGVRNVLI